MAQATGGAYLFTRHFPCLPFLMKWSLRLGRFLGIDVFLHVTFLILVAIVWYTTRQDGLGKVLFMLCMFTCVVLHEYGHALMARRFGVATRDITLLPIGGVARLERMPAEPWQELLVAVAGPAVNVVIAAALWTLSAILKIDPLHKIDRLLAGEGHFLVSLIWWNLTMVVFNMLPAFPMDGGRVLRALLAMKLPYDRATRAAAIVGKCMAVLFAYYALFHVGNPILVLIAFFVWTGATDETIAAEQRTLLAGARASDAMLSEFRFISPDDEIRSVAHIVLNSWQTDFPVVENDVVIGLLTRQDVSRGLTAGPDLPVRQFMSSEVISCLRDEPLEAVLDRIREADLPLIPVLDDNRLIGLVTPGNTMEFIAFRRAIAARLT